MNTVSSANASSKHADSVGAELLSVALIGPNQETRAAVARALGETRRANVRQFNSYPPGFDHLRRLLASFDVIMLDLDSDQDFALELVEKASAGDAGKIIVYSEQSDPKLAVRTMRAGAREYLMLPLEPGAVTEALNRTATGTREKSFSAERPRGKLLVFVGSKGGCGVTTVACNIAIALAQKPEQRILLIDLALPIGDAALCLGIAADYSTEDALRNIDQMDAGYLQSLLVQHRSGVFVLAAPTKVPEVQVSKAAIDKLIAIARHDFDHVIVDVGSRIDVAAKALFQDASTIYLVTQTGISELRNSNRLISQFFADGSPNLEIVINRFESGFPETVNEDVIAKALGRPVRWKIPDDQDAARALQHGDATLAEASISHISLEMASSITGRPIVREKKKEFDLRAPAKGVARVEPAKEQPPSAPSPEVVDTRPAPTITWAAPDPITYGEKLTATQLNATASVAGAFVYTPGPGYQLPVGTHTLWVTFTAQDSGGQAPVQAATSIVVSKASPSLTWQAPAELIHGTPLGDDQLNATASVPGTFDYSPAHGKVLPMGTHSLSVTFTPADSANYATAQATASIKVVRIMPAVQWPASAPITYGTQLSATQLCATASVPGTFEYNPGLGAVLAAGEHKLSAVFTPSDTMGYSASQTTVSLTVAKATPSITWPAPEPITHGVALSAVQLNATVNVPGSLAYSPALGAILAPGVHKLSVTFTPADTLNYASERAVVTLTVAEKIPAQITWPVPSSISYGTPLSATQLNATASVPGTFVYTPSAGHVLAPGRYTLSVSFTPSDPERYATAQAAVVLEVEGPSDMASLPSAAIDTPLQATETPYKVQETPFKASETPYKATETPSDAAATPYKWTFTATNSAPADSPSAAVRGERTASKTKPRETRIYKGAIYERGEDGQWHLQKK